MEKEQKASQAAYFHNLDSWRFVAFLTVFVSHAALFLGYAGGTGYYEWVKRNVLVNGDIGVSFFFVLSGFLITFLLMRERAAEGTVSLRRFYGRRVLRIWPVYFITLLLGFFILPSVLALLGISSALPFAAVPSLESLPQYLVFLANFPIAFGRSASVPTDVLWSISVEEQFYLVWPLVILLAPRRHLSKIIIGIIACASLYRFSYAERPDVIAYSTFSVMADLAVGALLAWFCVERRTLFERAKKVFHWAIVLAYMATAALTVGRHAILDASWGSVWHPLLSAAIPLVLAFLFAFIIFEQNEAISSPFKMGRSRLATSLGKVSYGLYAYHAIAMSMVLAAASMLGYALHYTSLGFGLILGSAALALTVLMAVLSYRYIESWFLAKKHRAPKAY